MASVNNTLVGAVRAEATLEGGKFVDGAKKIRLEAKKTESELKKSFGGMTAAVKGFAGSLTAGLALGALAAGAKKLLDYAAAIGVVAKQLGVTTKELQTFRYAASQVGVKNTEADKGLEKLGTTLGKAAAGSSTAAKALAAVGVSVDDIKTKSRTEIFGQIADQMIKQGGAAKNAAAANAIFGESAAKLTPLLDKGSKGINQLSAAAERLGIVLSDQQIQNADQTAQKLEDVRAVLAAQIAGVVADNAASIVSLANALATLTSAIVNFLGSNPQAALAILGGLAGARFGVPGAIGGGIAGLFAGGKIAAGRDANSSDVNFLKQRLRKENNILRSYVDKNASGAGLNLTPQMKKVQQLTSSLQRALASQGGSAAVASLPLPQFLAKSGGGGGRKARAARGPRDRSDDVAFQFDQEMRRATMDTLRAQQSLATNAGERARISLQILDLEKETANAELDERVRRAERDFAEGKIDAATLERAKVQAESLRAEYEKKDALERQAISEELQAQAREDAARLADLNFDLEREKLQVEADLAETASAQRDVQLRLLDLYYRQEKARLNAILAEEEIGSLAWEEARRRLASLEANQAGRQQGVINSTRGPMEQFQAQFGDIGEELENLKVQGIMGAVDALSAMTEGWESMREVALNAIKQIIAELIRLQLMKMAANLIGAAAGAPGLGGALGGFSTAGLSFGGGGSLPGIPLPPGFAGGGSFNVTGRPGVDRNMLSLNGMPIARVSYGERVSVANDRGRMGPTIPSFTFVNHAPMSASQARATGRQAAAAFQRELAQANKDGY